MVPVRFSIFDYGLFGASLAISAVVGIYCGYSKKKLQSANDILFGGGKMPIIPTALSLLTSFVSGISLMGVPAEVYQRGVIYWWSRVFGTTVALLIVAYMVLPILYRWRFSSLYEYLDVRFGSRLLRVLGAVMFLLDCVFYSAVVLYGPAIALASVTGIKAWIWIVVVGMVCLIYTSIGGIKAVVWTDTLQACVMFAGILAIFFKGAKDAGGLKPAFDYAAETGRFDGLKNWDANPLQYMTMWTAGLGGIGTWLGILGINQIALQRYISLPNLRSARITTWINIPGYALVFTLTDFLGLIMLYYYRNCDPIASGQVGWKDVLVIRFAQDVLKSLKGLPGVFLACLFCGTLSSVSSCINSASAILLEDFIKPLFPKHDPKNNTMIVRVSTVVFGVLCMVVAFAAEPLGGILKAVLTLEGIIFGPTIGLFILGMVYPKANKYGAYTGLLVSCAFLTWVAAGNNLNKPYANYALPLSTDNCTVFDNGTYSIAANASSMASNFYSTRPKPLTGVSQIYYLHEVTYPVVGVILMLLIGIPVSMLFKDKGHVLNPKDLRRLTVLSIGDSDEVINRERMEVVKREEDMENFVAMDADMEAEYGTDIKL